MRRRGERGSRMASLLVWLGFFAVLGAAFAAGVAAGRWWPGPGARAEASRAPEVGRGGAEPEPAAPRVPPLTFYQELTAPLSAPAAPGPAARRAPVRPEPARSEPARAEPVARGIPPAGMAGAPRYAVQVGAFRQREAADALRTRLHGAGYDATVLEADGGPARYRVRVGGFATRGEAERAARDLAARLGVSAFVSAR